MALPKKTLYCTYGGSDKIYIMWIAVAESGDGYFIWYQFGARTGSLSKPATKTKSPQSLADATKAFDKEVEHRKTKKHYTDPEETGQPEVEHSSLVVEPSPAERPNVDCMECTAILDAEAAVRLLRSDDIGLHEKHDGIRLLIHATSEKVTAYNRTGGARAMSPVIEKEVKAIAKKVGTFLIDGEQVGDNYFAFDLLEFGGRDFRKQTFAERMIALDAFFNAAPKTKAMRQVETYHLEAEKVAALERLHGLQREGIVMKKMSSRYIGGSRKEWFKFKFVATASVIITSHNEKRSVVMSLLHDGQLRKVGDLPIPTNKQIPPVGSIAEVRYRKADPKSLNLIEMVFLNLREDVAREDCNTSQLKFTTKAA